MNLTDSHCHLDYPDFEPEIREVIQRARDAGISRMLTAGTRLQDTEKAFNLTERYPFIFCSVGTHPEYAREELPSTSVAKICDAALHPKVLGIGETGLDYHYSPDSKEEQQELFRLHLKAAKECRLSVIVHSRDAEEDTIRLLKEEASSELRGVLHCFSSKAVLAEAGLEMGFYVSASGIITFRKAEELREIFRRVPLDRLLIETDAPFLAPAPYRGKRNEPSYLIKTAEVLAEIKGVSVEVLAETTTENFMTLFRRSF